MKARATASYAMVVLAPVPVAYLIFTFFWVEQHRLQADFTGYYTAATVVARGMGGRLYDLDLQRQVQAEIIYPNRFQVGGVLPFQYPPFAVLPVMPLAPLPIGAAYYFWGVANLALFVAALALLSRWTFEARRYKALLAVLWLASFSFLPFLSALLLGQLSFLVLLSCVLGLHLLHRRADVAGGIVLAGMALKPHLLLVLPLWLLAKRRWGALAGLAGGFAALMGLSLVLVGPLDVARFLETNRETSGWIGASFNLNWFGFFNGLLGAWPGVALSATLAADTLSLALLWLAWRGPWQPDAPTFSLKLALLLLVSMAVAPHMYPHDLVLLLPVAFYGVDHVVTSRGGEEVQGRTKLLAAAVFVAALVDGYPLLNLPIRPIFLAIVVVGWAIFLRIRREECHRG